jgi:hypothetical protein
MTLTPQGKFRRLGTRSTLLTALLAALTLGVVSLPASPASAATGVPLAHPAANQRPAAANSCTVQWYNTSVELNASGSATDVYKYYYMRPPVAPGTYYWVQWGNVSVHVSRGSANLLYQYSDQYGEGFGLYAQAAGGGLFGHHSGDITAYVSIEYFTC